MNKIRIVIADDHAVLRAGLKMLLNSQNDMRVVGEAEDGNQVVRAAIAHRPDVVLMDLGMPGMGGIDATRAIRQAQPETRVLVLTMHDDESYFRKVLEAGAAGYVLKRAADTELLAAIRAVQRGEVYIYPAMSKVLVEEMLDHNAPAREGLAVLSDREREVLHLIAAGYTRQQIADKLCLSVKTVETYKARVMEKLRFKTRAELVRYALEKGLLTEKTARQENS